MNSETRCAYFYPDGSPCWVISRAMHREMDHPFTPPQPSQPTNSYIPEGGVWTREEREAVDLIGYDSPESERRAVRTVAALLAALKDEHGNTVGERGEPPNCRVCALIAEVEK